MNKTDIEKNIKLIKFFQENNYIDRATQIKAFGDYDNYLDYFISEKLSFTKYLKIKAKSKLNSEKVFDKHIDSLINELDLNNTVCVIAPFYKNKPLDGYFKRIEQIDEQVLNCFNLIYLDSTDLGNRRFSINKFDDNHIIIKFNSFNDRHLDYIEKIINVVKKVFIHSIHVLMPDVMNYKLIDIIFDKENKTILDLHGVVPEELKQFDSLQRAEIAELVEEIVLNKVDKAIGMSKAMSDYYIEKYDIDSDRFVSISILPFKDNRVFEGKKANSVLNVVYSGGLQKWQNIDLIKEAVMNNLNNYIFKIFTHDSDKLKQDWSDIKSENLIIGSRTNEEIYKEYEECDFGFLLRDDNIINNLSCPTKSIEYISYGIIPILKSDRIGDYKEFGLNYIDINDFNNGIIPDENERKKMIKNNHLVYRKVVEQSLGGQNIIVEYLK